MSAPDAPTPPRWRRSVAALLLSQFCTLAAFNAVMPFAAYRIQEMGVGEPDAVRRWTILFSAAAPLALMLAQPLWGIAGDRWGRRPMLLRASFAAVIVVAAMAWARTPGELVVCRVLQGLFTGSVAAAQVLAVSAAPVSRQGFVMGLLSAALWSGMMAGAAGGAALAEIWGYRVAFGGGAAMALAGALIAWWGVREPAVAASNPADSHISWRRSAWDSAPVLGLVTMVALAGVADQPVLPLLVQELNGGLAGSARAMGQVAMATCVAGMLSASLAGWLADRWGPGRVAAVSAVAAAGACLLLTQVPGWGLAALVPLRGLLTACTAAIDPLLQLSLARRAGPRRRGAVIGLSAAARSLGWTIGPFLGGSLAAGRLTEVYLGLVLLQWH